MDEALRKRFEAAMFDVYRRARDEAKYNASAFLQMVKRDGGFLTAKALINAPRQSDGFTALYLAGRLDLTVEALVVETAEWRALFAPEEIARAERRLEQNGYWPKAALN